MSKTDETWKRAMSEVNNSYLWNRIESLDRRVVALETFSNTTSPGVDKEPMSKEDL